MGHILGIAGDASRAELTACMHAMQQVLAPWTPQGFSGMAVAGGHMGAANAVATDIPLTGSLVCADPARSHIAAMEGVLDNRAELLGLLDVPTVQHARIRDAELIHLAFRGWDMECVHRLLGDWSLVVWEPDRQRLTLARDHHGNSVLYYARTPHLIAFSSSPRALQALPWVARDLDDLSLAASIAHLEPLATRTLFRALHTVPPACRMQWQAGTCHRERYWKAEETAPWPDQTEATYIEALQAGILDAARRMVQRSRQPGITLSAGLDSGAVAWAAAQALGPEPELTAYCAVPVHDTQEYWPQGFIANELPGAQATARQVGMDRPRAVRAQDTDPLQGLDYMLQVNLEPSVGAGNMYWIAVLLADMAASGHDMILMGQQGNGTISWYGRPWSRTFRELARGRSLAVAMRHKIARPLLHCGLAPLYNRWVRGMEPWVHASLLQPAQARALHFQAYVAEAGYAAYYRDFHPDPVRHRLRVIEPGQSRVGARWAERGLHHGLRLRDPTACRDLIELCLSIPDTVWSGPRGTDRWLIRRAMTDRLPEELTSSLVRGRQASDLFQRLQAIGPQVARILDYLAHQEAVVRFLDMARARQIWEQLNQRPFSWQHQQRCLTHIMPALAYGLFLLREQDRNDYLHLMAQHRWHLDRDSG